MIAVRLSDQYRSTFTRAEHANFGFEKFPPFSPYFLEPSTVQIECSYSGAMGMFVRRLTPASTSRAPAVAAKEGGAKAIKREGV